MAKQSAKARRAAAERERRRTRAERGSDGRVHLAIHRDPVSRQERVVLKTPVFQAAWQNEIVAGAANTAHAMLREGPSVSRMAGLAGNVTAAMSRLSEALLARAPAGSVACRAGCDHCCHQVVGVTPPEALAIVEYLKQTLSKDELEQLRQHVARSFERARGLSSSERFSPEHACVFLRAGSCSVYDVRPLSCRGMNSLDAGECESRLRDPQARTEFLASGRGGHSYLEPIGGAQAISAGLQLGVSELYHLDMRPLDLAHAMHLLLGDDESLAEQWVNGQQPFEAALNQAEDLGLREIVGAVSPRR
jgi:Fe-S-cluster containining protein